MSREADDRAAWRLSFVVLIFLTTALHATEIDDSWTAEARKAQPAPDLSFFTFARGAYDSEGGYGDAFYQYDGRVWARWETDYPEADENFSARFKQLTSVNVTKHAMKRTFDAQDLGDLHLLYVADPGWMILSPAEIKGLRNYLLKGGMIWVDDFWGDGEWQQFEDRMREVLPEWKWREITPEHPIFHTVFD